MASESSRASRQVWLPEDIPLEEAILASDSSRGAFSSSMILTLFMEHDLAALVKKRMNADGIASAAVKAARRKPLPGISPNTVSVWASEESPSDEIGSCGERGSEGGGVEGGAGGTSGGVGGKGGSGGDDGIWGDGGGELGSGGNGGAGGDGGADGGRGGNGGGGDGAGITLMVQTGDCGTVAVSPKSNDRPASRRDISRRGINS
eukprot:CAMPEP_0113260910 /NCGR_PEP_ID=MMETSP0008_2-20120614/17128_1 /TAXON_ID=97485 /ORGANISM="Prymnesium parvum" /LENGTH=204 /DNA_ID=CAMNT_0000109509 /DNA_START=687 /DNA_END=1298 /DNA_ORIENTATION=- /assembly_acc=CAM_ASM_000153